MDELHYVDCDPQKIWDAMAAAHIEAGGSVLFPGDEKEILLRGMQAVLVAQSADYDNAARMQTLRYAKGDYLKNLGENAHVPYLDARPATGILRVTIRKRSGSVVIPAGTLFTLDGLLTYEATEDAGTLSDGLDDVVLTVPVSCTTRGTAGNGLAAGTTLNPVSTEANIVASVLVSETSGGREAEDEEEYRERIRTSGGMNATTGTVERYASVALSASTAVLDARPVRTGDGEVTVYLILEDGLTEDEAKKVQGEVEAALTPKTQRPLTDRVIIALAEEVPYTISLEFTMQDGAKLSDALTTIDAFKAEQEGICGIAFDPNRLLSALYLAGCTRVQFRAGSTLNGSSNIVWTEISEHQRWKGTISA